MRILKVVGRPAESWLVARTWLFLLVVRGSLAVTSFRRVRTFFERWNEPRRPPRGVLSREELAWAVRTAGRYVPSSKPCLTQALVLDSYLRRRGISSRVAIGVTRARGESLEAHAWVESEGEVLLGGEDLERYTELRSSEADALFR